MPVSFDDAANLVFFADGDDPTDPANWIANVPNGYMFEDAPAGSKAVVNYVFMYTGNTAQDDALAVIQQAGVAVRVALAKNDGSDPSLTTGSAVIALQVIPAPSA